MAKEQPFF